MILSGHQPVYLPGIIVMAKIAISDKFMFVGHCDYQPKSWQARNYIRGNGEPLMLQVPVHKGISIDDTRPIEDIHWRLKHLRSIELRYHKRPFFDDYYPLLTTVIMYPFRSLADLNVTLMERLLDWLGIETPTYQSQDFEITGHKTAMLINMCKAMGADHYLSSPGEIDYVRPDEMGDIRHSFLRFTHPVYNQGYRKFVHNLSVIDLLFNCGPESGRIVRNSVDMG